MACWWLSAGCLSAAGGGRGTALFLVKLGVLGARERERGKRKHEHENQKPCQKPETRRRCKAQGRGEVPGRQGEERGHAAEARRSQEAGGWPAHTKAGL